MKYYFERSVKSQLREIPTVIPAMYPRLLAKKNNLLRLYQPMLEIAIRTQFQTKSGVPRNLLVRLDIALISGVVSWNTFNTVID